MSKSRMLQKYAIPVVLAIMLGSACKERAKTKYDEFLKEEAHKEHYEKIKKEFFDKIDLNKKVNIEEDEQMGLLNELQKEFRLMLNKLTSDITNRRIDIENKYISFYEEVLIDLKTKLLFDQERYDELKKSFNQ